MSVCHSVTRITESNEPISLKLGIMIGPTNRKNWLTFRGDSLSDTDSGSLFNFPHRCGIGDFRKLVSISHSVTTWFFTKLGKMTDADKVMNPRHFGRDPADIWINPAIRITFGWNFGRGLRSLRTVLLINAAALILCLLTADGNCKVRHCEPLHCGARAFAGYDGRLLADGLGAEVVADCDVDDGVWTRSGQMSPVLAGAVRRRHALRQLCCHCRQGRNHAAICFSRLHCCKFDLPVVFFLFGCWVVFNTIRYNELM